MFLPCIGYFRKKRQKEKKGKLGIVKTQTTSYHPQSNGLTERVNKTLVNALRTAVQENVYTWDLMLPHVLLSTGFSPSMTLIGQEPRLPADIVVGLPEKHPTSESSSHHILDLLGSLRAEHENPRVKDDASHTIQKDYYDTKVSGSYFKVGDIVWLLDPVIPRREVQKKFHLPGSNEVVKEQHPVYDIVVENNQARLHFNRFKKCHGYTSLEAPMATPSQCHQVSLPAQPVLSFPDDVGMGAQHIGHSCPFDLRLKRVKKKKKNNLPLLCL